MGDRARLALRAADLRAPYLPSEKWFASPAPKKSLEPLELVEPVELLALLPQPSASMQPPQPATDQARTPAIRASG